MSDDRTTAFGMWRYGNDFREAAIAVAERHNVRVFMPYYFLLGQSIELSLKAFLMGREVPLDDLRKKFRHDLKKLLTEARRRRLGLEVKLDKIQCGVIELLNVEYAERRFQYIQTGSMIIPEPEFAAEAADRLSIGLKEYCRKATWP